MRIKFIALILISLSIFTSCNRSESEQGVIKYAKANGFPIKGNNVENADPAILFCYSYHLWLEGEKQDAVFWYYVAQYRYRILSSCSEKLQAGSVEEDTAKDILLETGVAENKESLSKLHLIGGVYRIDLYETIQSSLGYIINGYAYGNLKDMCATLDKVIAYQEEHPFNPMGLHPKPVFKNDKIVEENLVKVKDSYLEQKEHILNNAETIKAQRAENGLETVY